MKNLRLAVMFAGGLVGLTGFLFACSSDDTIIVYPDASTDGGPDQSSPPDGGVDTGVPVNDAGPDAPTFPDAGLTLDNYTSVLAETLCRSLARCCFDDADLDAGEAIDGGGKYDKEGCFDFYKKVGFESSAGELPPTNENLVLDNAKGDECIAKLNTLTCNTPGVMYTTVAKACFAAIVGKHTAGQSCTKSIECAAGHFCNVTDGGVGACEALRGLDGNCGDWFPNDDPSGNAERAAEACSYRGKGVDTGRYCDVVNFASGDYRPQSEWKCKLAGGIGAQCVSTPWCKDALCDDITPTFTCQSPKLFFAPTPPGSLGGCGKFAVP